MTLPFKRLSSFPTPVYRASLSPDSPRAYLICKPFSTWTAQYVDRRGNVTDIMRFAEDRRVVEAACLAHSERL